MSYGTEFLKGLLAGADPAKLAAFVKTIKPDAPVIQRDKNKENGPIKTYTTIIKQYTCLACDSKFSTKYNMAKGEQTFCLDPHGNVHYVTISGKPGEIQLPCFASKCMFCKEKASTWSREKLERKWLALVKASSFKEVVSHKNSMLEKN